MYENLKLNVHKFGLKYLIFLAVFLVLPLIDPRFFLLGMIIFIDMMWLKLRITLEHDLPFDFHFIGMFINSYFGGAVYGLIFLAYAFMARLALGLQSPAHFKKQPIFIVICIVVSLMHSIEFTMLGIILYIIRYLSEYVIGFMFTGTVSFDRIGFRMCNICTAAVTFILIGNIMAMF